MNRRPSRRNSLAALLAACMALLVLCAAPASAKSIPPRITSAKTSDTNANGKVDKIRVGYSKRVGLLPGKGTLHLGVSAYTVRSVALGTGVRKLRHAKRCYPHRVIRRVSSSLIVRVAEKTSYDTAATPAVQYARSKTKKPKVVDSSCHEAYNALYRSTRDGAGPVLVSASTSDANGDGRIDAIKATFSEPVSHPGASGGLSDVAVAGYTVTSITQASAAATLKVSLTQAGSPDTANRPAVSYDPAGGGTPVTDAAGNPVPSSATVGSADAAGPAIVAASTDDSDADGKLDTIHLTFSEPVTHTAQSSGPFPLAVQGRSVTSVGAPYGGNNHLDVRIAEAGFDTGATPQVSGSGNGSAPIVDTASNPPPSNQVSPTDAAPPVLVSGQALEAGTPNGRIDAIRSIWSEPVDHVTDVGGNYPLSITAPVYTIGASGIGAGTGQSILDIPVAERSSPDRDKSPFIAYDANGPGNAVTDTAGLEGRTSPAPVSVTPACSDPSENNTTDDDSRAQATLINQLERDERLCGGDEDWFQIAATDQLPLQVLVHSASALDAKVDVVDSSGNVLGTADANPEGGDEMLSVSVPTSGIYYLRVYSAGFVDANYCLDATIDGSTPACHTLIN